MDIAKRIKALREGKGLRQSDVAEKMGLETPNYSRYEKRGEDLTLKQVKQIASAIGFTLKELLFDEKGEGNNLEVQILQVKTDKLEQENDYLKEQNNRLLTIIESRQDQKYIASLEKEIEEYKKDLLTVKRTLEKNGIDAKELFGGGSAFPKQA